MVKVTFKKLLAIALLFSLRSFCEDLKAISLSGENPQMSEIGHTFSRNFNYNSYGTQQLGLGVLYNNDWYSLTLSDPRDTASQKTDSAILQFRSFGEIQWGFELLHFKNFGLYSGTDSLGPVLENRTDIEIYSTQLFVLKNINHPEYSIEDSLKGFKKISESGWAAIYGAKLSNTYLHGDGSIVPLSYSATTANQVNSYNFSGLVGIGGTFVLKNFYFASQLSIGAGPLYTTWNDATGAHQHFSILGYSHVFDVVLGYSSEKWTTLLRISTIADSTEIEGLSFENLGTNSSLVFTYRF